MNPFTFSRTRGAARFVFACLSALGASSEFANAAADWQKQTHLVAQSEAATAVYRMDPRQQVFVSADPQAAIEWSLLHAKTTVILPGKYLVEDRIDIPRSDITLIIAQGAEIELNPDTEHTSIGFGSNRNPGYWQIVPLIYNQGHDNVATILFGTLVHSIWDKGTSGKQTFPIIYDGRTETRSCGIEGGRMVIMGSSNQSFWIVDSCKVNVPIVALDTGLDAVLVLEGSEDCHLGFLTNLARTENGQTGETVDLNSRNRGIQIDQLIGERSYEVIDCNESHATVERIISIGEPRKLVGGEERSGPRFTQRDSHLTRSLEVNNTIILGDARQATLSHNIPPLPEALPRFTAKAQVAVTLSDGSTARFEKSVTIDIR